MSKHKKEGKMRLNLHIEIDDFKKSIEDFKESENRNNVMIKPLRSAKNTHQLKNFNFDEDNIQLINTERKIQKLHQLQQQKCNLIQSLEILKESAISAIAQKEDQIEKLKVFDHLNIQQKLQYYQTQLYRSNKLRKELEEERDQLYRQFKQDRSKYANQLEEKEYLIETLYEDIQEIRTQVQILQQNDLAKAKKIKLLQQENTKLSAELQEISLSNSLREITQRMDLDQTIKIKPPSVISSIHSQGFVSLAESHHEHFDSVDKSYFSQKIEELNKTHKEDIIELKNFYEKRIAALRDIYQRELNLPTQQSQKDQSICRSKKLQKKGSKRNLKGSLHTNQHNFNLNLKDMYSIQEHAQEMFQTQRAKGLDLKYQIKMQNLSECPSVQPRIRTQEDQIDTESANSQFTAKYFENPFRFMKKNKSSETFKNQEDEKTVLKVKRQEDHSQSQAAHQKEKEKGQDFWSKTKIFAVGMLSGITLTAVASLISKKS